MADEGLNENVSVHLEVPESGGAGGELSDEEEKRKSRENSPDPSDAGSDDNGEEELLFPGFVAKSLYCLTQRNKLRYCCLKLITWPYPFIQII